MTWAAKRRILNLSWPQWLGVGLLVMPVTLFADLGHAMAHTIGAHLAGAYG